MKRMDVFLIAGILLLAAAAAVFIHLFTGGAGATLSVLVDGDVFGEYSLFEDRTIDIENEFGFNRVVIKKGSVYVESADCPDKYCVTHKPINGAGESIICLPHRLVLSVSGGGNEKEIDGVTR